MPLFEAIEHEISAFFVSQGTILDCILKAVLDRVAQIESKVENNTHVISSLVANSYALLPPAAVDEREVSQQPTTSPSDAAAAEQQDNALEAHVMALARQLNVVLALLLQPLAVDAVASTRLRHEKLPSVADVIADNEAILTSYSATLAADSAATARCRR
ncbi:hypothetical protein ATCC90586_010887 [Pythium insidiosum]|nr:hypothetical protein ATCC90586_010887 [Pythium insidiosum]